MTLKSVLLNFEITILLKRKINETKFTNFPRLPKSIKMFENSIDKLGKVTICFNPTKDGIFTLWDTAGHTDLGIRPQIRKLLDLAKTPGDLLCQDLGKIETREYLHLKRFRNVKRVCAVFGKSHLLIYTYTLFSWTRIFWTASGIKPRRFFLAEY